MLTSFGKIKRIVWLLVFVGIASFSRAYASQEYVGRGSYTGTLNENRSTKVGSEVENYVVLHSYDLTEASLSNHYYITGTLLNDSYGGVYDITLTIHWKDAAGNDLGTERVYTIVGLPAGIRGSFSDIDEDYIPPLEKGYFHGLIEIPENANVRTITYSTEWTWTLEAYVNTSVIIPDNTVSISDVNFGYRDVMGTVSNRLSATLEYVEVIAIVLLSDGTVADIENTYVATSDAYMLPSSSKDFSVSIRPLFSDGKDIRVLTRVSFSFLDDNLIYRGDGTDDGRAFVTPGDTVTPSDTIKVTVRDTIYSPSDTIKVTVRDTIYSPSDTIKVTVRDTIYSPSDTIKVTVRDTIYSPSDTIKVTVRDTIYSPSDTIKVTVRDTIYIDKPRLLGDLDSNGIVDFADFLLFVANFGKTQSVSEQPEQPPVKKYSSCTEMRADWPKGVNKNGGTYYEAWNDAEKRTYEMNSGNLDRDNDSHACE